MPPHRKRSDVSVSFLDRMPADVTVRFNDGTELSFVAGGAIVDQETEMYDHRGPGEEQSYMVPVNQKTEVRLTAVSDFIYKIWRGDDGKAQLLRAAGVRVIRFREDAGE